MTYYNETVEMVRQHINGSQRPLTENQLQINRKKYGINQLPEVGKKSIPVIFFTQFEDFLVVILIAAAVVSGFLGDISSAAVILTVILINAVIGTVETVKAEQSLKSLQELSAPTARVLRDGAVIELPAREVTAGDEVYLEAGDFVPADGRLLTAVSLKVDESALTGESLGVEKTTEVIHGDVPLGDRKNMVYSGSFVIYGRGSYLVTDVGMGTEMGKIAFLIKNAQERKTPLQRSLDLFGRRLSGIILCFCALLFGISLYRGESLSHAFLFSVALAVAAIPEALGSIVTIVLAFGTRRMAREGAVIRRLQAVEGLGSVSVICSDKTGTLTQNKMTVEDYYIEGKVIPAESLNADDPLHAQMFRFSVLCSDAVSVEGKKLGDPTETALVSLGERLGISAGQARREQPRLGELPFDSDRKRMSTFHRDGEGYLMVTKGAVDMLLPCAAQIQMNGEIRPISDADKETITECNRRFSGEGLRVLAVAYRRFDSLRRISFEDERELVFLGLISLMDPPREESADAVAACIRAGIRPVMITGDHRLTASAIARRIGILRDESEVCEGSAIDGMPEEELREFVGKFSVYARVSPEHKIRIVKAWQERGHIVAMTGDGVNDAPALKQADIGVAMGLVGSEVSRSAAAMVLTDDNFATIVRAVENGRNIYGNIRNSIRFLLSGNFGAILAVLYASLAALPIPFAPVHLLFVNLLTDSLPAIALGLEPHRPEVMEERPRAAEESVLSGGLACEIALEGSVIGVTSLAAFYIGYAGGDALLAGTMAFAVLCLGRLVHGYNCKSRRPLLFRKGFWNNRYLQGAFLIGFLLLNAVLLFPPLYGLFHVTGLTAAQLLTVYGLAFLNLPVIQFLKEIREILRSCRKSKD